MPDGGEEEKTEDPTPKRKEEAREEGQVPKSEDLNKAVTLLLSFIILYFIMVNLVQEMTGFMHKIFTDYMINKTVTALNFHTLAIEIIQLILGIIAPLMIGIMVVGILLNLLQFGFLFSPKIIQPDPSVLNPIEGAKQIFSKKTVAELVKSIFKIALIAYIAYLTISQDISDFALLVLGEVRTGMEVLAGSVYRLAMRVSAALIVIGLIDLFYQRWQHEQDLKMSKTEVEEEQKQREGDPELKSEREERQQEMAQQRMMQDVPEADVVITNPTHFAIALQFELDAMEAPLVVAKGQDEIAHRIKEVAREHEIEIVEEKELAQTMYELVEVGEEIPAELYQAVAEILAYVYELDEQNL